MIIATIIGVRPQFVKASVLSPIIRKEHKEILIHTGQHYDDNMSAVFFRELGLPEPDYNLKACSDGVNTVERMTGNLISVLRKEQVDAVLLYGDTNSTLAGALAADKLKIPAIHVEAGERNGLIHNPEEGGSNFVVIIVFYKTGDGKFAVRGAWRQGSIYGKPDGGFFFKKCWQAVAFELAKPD